MRLIDADELIEHAWRDKLDSRELIVEMINNAPTVKEMPTKIPIDIFEKLVSQELKWIPVSERLPNRDEYIKNNGLFNVSDGNRSYSEWFDIYDKRRFGEPTIMGFRVDYAVTAWMPLSEPYKAESEG